MDSPDRMSWTPSSSAKKRKHDDFIENCVHICIPGAYPKSPEGATHNFHGRQLVRLLSQPAASPH